MLAVLRPFLVEDTVGVVVVIKLHRGRKKIPRLLRIISVCIILYSSTSTGISNTLYNNDWLTNPPTRKQCDTASTQLDHQAEQWQLYNPKRLKTTGARGNNCTDRPATRIPEAAIGIAALPRGLQVAGRSGPCSALSSLRHLDPLRSLSVTYSAVERGTSRGVDPCLPRSWTVRAELVRHLQSLFLLVPISYPQYQ